MYPFNFIVAFFWLIFLIVWFLSAFGAKKSLGKSRWLKTRLIFVAVVALVIVTLRMPIFGGFLARAKTYVHISTGGFAAPVAILGVVLVAAGIAFAVWARLNLGKNWGMPMTEKENPELVRSGPYKLVRHPIYTGLILSLVGTALVEGAVWFIPFLFLCIYFVYSAVAEDRIMLRRFPEEYGEYMSKVKRLIPFVW